MTQLALDQCWSIPEGDASGWQLRCVCGSPRLVVQDLPPQERWQTRRTFCPDCKAKHEYRWHPDPKVRRQAELSKELAR